jgi:hypothetical protein
VSGPPSRRSGRVDDPSGEFYVGFCWVYLRRVRGDSSRAAAAAPLFLPGSGVTAQWPIVSGGVVQIPPSSAAGKFPRACRDDGDRR